ncbi:MAG TPA: ABC transporter substrate-binding protein [Methylomirabilota bacterium]|jgi:putative ABC transport system substrate-binding protein|nr:ABC transporter substrate-binding protein [Methylomirabilota bacterium]
MRRLVLILSGALALLALPLAARAQAGKIPRIGLLEASSPRPELGAPLKHRLRELGYVEGQTVVFEPRWAHDKVERLPDLAAELAARRVDVIVTTGTPAALAAKRATNTIPIVMASGSDPVGYGLVASLARPGGNVTGLTSVSEQLIGKRVELVRELVPELARLAVLWDPANPASAEALRETRKTAQPFGVQVEALGVRDAREFDGAFAAMARGRADALLVIPSATFLTKARRLAELALKHRLPAVYGRRDYVEAGGLASYAASFPDLFRRAAEYVDRILKGARPADLPVEQATKTELVINFKTVKALGLTIPQSVLLRTDDVIE